MPESGDLPQCVRNMTTQTPRRMRQALTKQMSIRRPTQPLPVLGSGRAGHENLPLAMSQRTSPWRIAVFAMAAVVLATPAVSRAAVILCGETLARTLDGAPEEIGFLALPGEVVSATVSGGAPISAASFARTRSRVSRHRM